MQRFLVGLQTNKLVKEVATLVGKRRYSQAIAVALAKGRFEREIPDNEYQKIAADVILTEGSVHWDLT